MMDVWGANRVARDDDGRRDDSRRFEVQENAGGPQPPNPHEEIERCADWVGEFARLRR